MSDFFQHGLISTLHRLNPAEPVESEGLNETGLGLLLPCHLRDIGSKALADMIQTLNRLTCFEHVIVSVNGAGKEQNSRLSETSDVGEALQFWTQLRTPHTVLGNDSPAFVSWLRDRNLPAVPGKGLNLWTGLGFALCHTELQALIIHDCDIQNYTASLPVSLAIPVARLDYQFCKGFYSRVQEQLYGRATRLFMIPLVRALGRTLGHVPLLDFIDSFRYPLAGECALSTGVAASLSVENGWGVEIGWLCEAYRLIDPEEICQVDLAMRYHHRHQSIDPGRPAEGLLGMVADIALSLFTHLEKEGCRLDSSILEQVVSGYEQTANDMIRRYRDVAEFNKLPFARDEERQTARLFQERLRFVADEFSSGARMRSLPPWDQFLREASYPVDEIVLGHRS
jgi:glucosyl-3-phosphoglycerate synthase